MRITGTRSKIWFDLENGYVLKASGELLASDAFVVDVKSMKVWEPPHQDEPISKEQLDAIIEEAKKPVEGVIELIFE